MISLRETGDCMGQNSIGENQGTPSGRIGAEADRWFTPARFAVLLAVLIGAAFPDVLFGRSTFFFRDFGFFGYPLAHHHRVSFWNGEIPLWNPLSNCGLPFLAQWNTLVLYPGSLIYLLLPLPWSLNAFCLIHLFVAGLAMYFLANRWVGSQLAAAVAGLAFAFNGLSLNCLMWPNNIAALSLMPLVVLFAERAWREGGRTLVWSALIGATQMLSGAPEIILFTWTLTALLALLTAARAARFALVVLLVAGIAAAQALPFLELLAQSQRDTGFAKADWPMPATGWANLVVPLFRTFRNPLGVHLQFGQTWTSSYYAGIGILALASIGAWRERNRRVWFLTASVLLSLVFALGDNGYLYGWIIRGLPLLGFMRYPVKFVIVVIFCLPLLAAYGIRYSLNAPRTTAQRAIGIVLVILLGLSGALLWFGGRFPVPNEDFTKTWTNGLARAGFLMISLLSLLAIPRVRRFQLGLLIRLGLLFALVLDVLTHAPRQNPSIEPAALEPGLLPLRQLDPRPEAGHSRAMLTAEADLRLRYESSSVARNNYLVKRLAMFANCNLLEGLPKVNGFYSLYLRAADEVLSLIYGPTNRMTPQLLDLLAVSQITKPGELFEWQSRSNYLPVVSAGAQPRFANPADTLEAIASADFNPRQVVYLPLEAASKVAATNHGRAEIGEPVFSAHDAIVRVQGNQPAILVISQAHYRPWRAYVDDRETPIWRANRAFQAVEVPAGSHAVRLVYQDRLFDWGILISVLCWSGCLAWIVRARAT